MSLPHVVGSCWNAKRRVPVLQVESAEHVIPLSMRNFPAVSPWSDAYQVSSHIPRALDDGSSRIASARIAGWVAKRRRVFVASRLLYGHVMFHNQHAKTGKQDLRTVLTGVIDSDPTCMRRASLTSREVEVTCWKISQRISSALSCSR